MKRNGKNRRAGFTLVELLVVIVIIGILASLVTMAVFKALQDAKSKEMQQECTKILGAFESFKEKFNSLPPDGNGGMEKMRRFVRKAFPMAKSQSTTPDGEVTQAQTGPARGLVYWLSEISTDPRQPFRKESGGFGGQKQDELFYKFYDFQAGRLDKGKYYPKGYEFTRDPPFLYFVWETYAMASYRTPEGLAFKPYDRGQSNSQSSGSRGGGNSREYCAAETCQIVAGGLDKKLGTGGTLMLDSAQASGGAEFISEEDEDNVVSFDTRRIGDIKG